jgi:phage gpG-like protein
MTEGLKAMIRKLESDLQIEIKTFNDLHREAKYKKIKINKMYNKLGQLKERLKNENRHP